MGKLERIITITALSVFALLAVMYAVAHIINGSHIVNTVFAIIAIVVCVGLIKNTKNDNDKNARQGK